MQKIDLQFTENPHRLVEAGPIVLVTTHYQGKHNVMTMGFYGMIQHNPPLLACVIGPWDYSYQALKVTGECVISIPTVELAETIVDIGNCSGKDYDKFERFNLTALPGREVKAPLIEQCLANIECRVTDFSLVNKYNMFIMEALVVWADPQRKERRILHHNGDGTFNIQGEHINLKHRMTKWEELL